MRGQLMSTVPTNKPVPSKEMRDLAYNAERIDEFVTSLQHEYKDRFGQCHRTIEGINWVATQLIERFKVEMEQAILVAGYVPVGTFQEGAELANRNETVLWKLPDGDGDHYRWDGDLPKPVPAGSTPQSTGGIGKGAWVSVGDATVRPWVMENYTEAYLLKIQDSSFTTGGTIDSKVNVLGHSDGFYYQYVGGEDFPVIVTPNSTPNDQWACVGSLSGYHVDNIKNYITQELRLIDSFNLAQNSKQKRGGGCILVPAGDYYLEDELALIDFVMFVGEGERVTRIFGSSSAIGTGKAVVRSSKLPITTTENPAYLSHTGFTDATINGNGVFDVGLYIRNTTNESKFTNVTTQNCKVANTNIISSWYVNMDNHVSRDALGYGVVIGRKLFNEVGLDEVNACSFLNLRSNYSGKDDTYDPVNAPYAGSGITIWKATSCAFDYVGAENSYGVGCVIRKGIVSVIPNIYTEANGRGTKATDKIGVYVINADFAPLQIGSLNLTSQQKLFLDVNSVCTIGSLYTHDFSNGVFLGSGKVILINPQDANFIATSDLAYVRNILMDSIGAFNNLSMTSFTALNSSAFYCGSNKVSIKVMFNPRATFSHSDPIIIRFITSSGNVDINFGTSFTAGTPVVKSIDLPKGVIQLKQQSNSLPSTSTNAAADIFVYQYHIDGFPIYNLS